MTATVLVFLKYPEPGKVKTRLAAAIGPDRAAALYREWIGVVLRELQPVRERATLVGYHDGGSADRFAEWSALVDDWWQQPAGDLGTRLSVGFATAHARGGPVLAVGTDCPEIDARLIDRAFDLLQTRDAVFGPAADGGYYLVGTARHRPDFFEAVRWSSPHTLADHLARCRDSGWSVGLLPELADIDTGDDWQAYLARRGASRDR
ncbi:MAG TPA: TIGR04282 family arsenosugar biosynthesis glycosyltransferase [Fimbriiglobus sp.]|nr:TIGR04282 family arsenosugar biosynthesis glycosyltransferase [Fimbriiglobus sp.]